MKTKQSCQIETGGEIKVRDRWLKKENKNKCDIIFSMERSGVENGDF